MKKNMGIIDRHLRFLVVGPLARCTRPSWESETDSVPHATRTRSFLPT